MQIKSALISVFNKEGIDSLAQELAKNQVKIYSTGGTQKYLENLGIPVEAVEDYTNYPAVFGGRVKTLHPAIFGGILYRRENEQDLKELEEHGIPSIDLVIVDLYPFEATLASGAGHQEIIEKIDIGGISLIRATAKNYKDTAIISSKVQYEEFERHYKSEGGSTTEEFRKSLAAAAFETSMSYDRAIGNYFKGNDVKVLRYGENPHQEASFIGNIDELFEQLGGKELSYNNLLDVDAAVNLIMDIRRSDQASFAVLKHNNACGCAQRDTVLEAFEASLAADPVSAFGGIFISDRKIDKETAEEINKIFYEICIAPEFDPEALEILSSSKKRILLKWNMVELTQDIERTVLNGKLVQARDMKNVKASELEVQTKKKPTDAQIEDLLFADKLVKNTKSNAIILVKDGQLLASGTGQTSRVDALRQAITKAKAFNFDLKDCVMASDAFFPFPDCVEIGAEAGVAAIIQPGGSIKDNLSIDACDERGLTMVFTGTRHFKH
ncbi:bifunctional phosphoribosylaminoimidazolecarboxamide formyltransferase/IMP cyclohydrolase [bacterium]|nr:bifunctional phosphoribosylaminoimidazolecarboxamide formyltransferase/IMP cyclohydrolase [bacterium]